MTEYTPEKVADLIAEARYDAKVFLGLSKDHAELADALIAVSAERDKAEAIISEQEKAIRHLLSEQGRLRRAITEALAERMNMEADRILRAALDKEGQTDE